MNNNVKRYLNSLPSFSRAILIEVMKIPKGKTKTYKEIAKAIGRPNAYRAVGNVLNKNKYPIRIPCHRVIRSDGKVGGYSKGVDTKSKLLQKEKTKTKKTKKN